MSWNLYTLPIHLIYQILDELDDFDLFVSCQNLCSRFNVILNTYQRYQMFSNKLLFVMFRNVSSIQHTTMLLFSKSIKLMNNLNSSMKKLIDAHKYQEALNLFQQSSIAPSDFTINLALKACVQLKNLKYTRQIHTNLSSKSINNIHIQTSLIHLYMTCNDVNSAYRVFDQIENKSCGLYGAMFKGLIKNEQYEKVFQLFDQMTMEPDDFTLHLLFTACGKLPNEHAKKIKNKYLNQIPKVLTYNNYVLTSFLYMLMNFGDISQAVAIFDRINNKDIVSYGTMMQGFIKNEQYEKVFHLFDQMTMEPDDVILSLLFTACGKLPNEHAKKIKNKYLNQIPKVLTYNNYVLTSFLNMLMSFGDISQAESVFAQMNNKDIVSYGTMMQGLIKNEQYEKVFQLFDQMSIEPNNIVLNLLFTACGKLPNEHAKKIKNQYLNQIPKVLTSDKYVLTSFLSMLMSFGDISQAESVFAQMNNKDIITYGAMMQGFLQNKMFEKTLDLFEQMPFHPNEIILIILFKTCTQLANERALKLARKHFKTTPTKSYNNPKLFTSTLHMLFTFGAVSNAEKLFNQINMKNVMHYEVMMNGYNMNDQPDKCLQLFEQIQQQQQNDVVVGDGIYTSALRACSQIALFTRCQSVIDQIPSSLLSIDRVQCALIDTWGKVGYIDKAIEIFEQIQQPNVIIYTAMINSFGLNGRGYEAIELYQRMSADLPNEVTHICVLNACSHSGLVNQAYSIYNDIKVKTDRIVTTMVDCLSRLGMFNEAEKLIDQFESSHPPNIVMFMALISGTRNHRQHHLTQQIYNKMKSRFPNYQQGLKTASVLLENTYRSVGEYEEALKVCVNRRKEMGARTVVGMSWTEPNGQLVKFKAHDRSHPDSDKIYVELKRISAELVQHGHEYNSTWITRPLGDDETIETVLCGHSEKLALAFNFIQEPIPNVIQITKNLRICGDCHSALKLIAKIRQRPIIIRDANRIHHIDVNGQCSCQDHF